MQFNQTNVNAGNVNNTMTTRACWYRLKTNGPWVGGKWHAWSLDSVDHGEFGPGHYPAAIIEDEASGKIHIVHASLVHFGSIPS